MTMFRLSKDRTANRGVRSNAPRKHHSLRAWLATNAALGGLAYCFIPLAADAAVRITSPANGTLVHPGDTVRVTVDASGQKFMMMSIEAAVPIEDPEPLTGPPYNFTIHIPDRITPGRYSLIASGVTSPGQGEESEAVVLDVEMPDAPTRIRTEPLAVTLAPGDRFNLSVWGRYKSGGEILLNNSTQTTFASSNPKVVTISEPGGEITAVGIGSAEIVVHVRDQEIRVKADVKRNEH